MSEKQASQKPELSAEDLDNLSDEELDSVLAGLADKELKVHSRPLLFGIMLGSAIVGLIAAFVLSIDAWRLASNPNAALSCDLNEVLSCSKVALTWQAQLLGFPNAFLGILFETVIITVALAMLGKARLPRWFMAGVQAMYFIALVFALWLFSQSMWVIGALCPWCLIITVTTSLVFFEMLIYNIEEDNLYLPRKMQAKLRNWVAKDYVLYFMILWIVAIVLLIFFKYKGALIG